MSAYCENRISLDVEIKNTSEVAIPCNASVVLVNVEKGIYHVVWGSDKDNACTMHYQLSQATTKTQRATVLSNQLCQM